jgi:hypothetical protein
MMRWQPFSFWVLFGVFCVGQASDGIPILQHA